MGQALYRKKRPKSFSEVVGQEPITKTLSRAIRSGKISHAYLLSGPRGVGKTSVARILAHEVNELPYKDESMHLDIIEIDAASNRRIDEIRDIREKVQIAPTSAKYKVYIIDEVHMLTKEAFNALLKTLEEPPAHCIFILATTEVHKLPETIVSRTQRFNFKPVPKDKAISQLSVIAKAEKIAIEPAALEMLADHGSGSFRDSLSLLDQLSGLGRTISPQDIKQLLGLPSAEAITKLIVSISSGNSAAALQLLSELRDMGHNPVLVAAQLGQQLRSQLLSSTTDNVDWLAAFLKNLLEISAAKQPYELLEIIVLEATTHNQSGNNRIYQKTATEVAKTLDTETEDQSTPAKLAKMQTGTSFSLDLWPKVLVEVKSRAASIYTALRLARPQLSGRVLTLNFQFPLHKKKVEQARHIQLISDVIEDLSSARLELRCALSTENIRSAQVKKTPPKTKRQSEPAQLATISNIFGSAEVLES